MHTYCKYYKVQCNYAQFFICQLYFIKFSSVQSLSHVQLFATPWTIAHQASLSIINSMRLLKLMSIESVMSSVSSSVISFFSHLQYFPSWGSFQMSQHFTSGGQNIGVSASTSVLPWIFRTNFLQDGLLGSPCSPRDSQESSPAPQFKSINSLVLRFLHSPTLTSIHDHWKNHSFD